MQSILYQVNWRFEHFLKSLKILKSSKSIFLHPRLRFTHKINFRIQIFKCLFENKIRFAIEKKNKKFVQATSIQHEKTFAVAMKKMLVIKFHMEIVWLAFFGSIFLIYVDTLNFMLKQEKVLWKFD